MVIMKIAFGIVVMKMVSSVIMTIIMAVTMTIINTRIKSDLIFWLLVPVVSKTISSYDYSGEYSVARPLEVQGNGVSCRFHHVIHLSFPPPRCLNAATEELTNGDAKSSMIKISQKKLLELRRRVQQQGSSSSYTSTSRSNHNSAHGVIESFVVHLKDAAEYAKYVLMTPRSYQVIVLLTAGCNHKNNPDIGRGTASTAERRRTTSPGSSSYGHSQSVQCSECELFERAFANVARYYVQADAYRRTSTLPAVVFAQICVDEHQLVALWHGVQSAPVILSVESNVQLLRRRQTATPGIRQSWLEKKKNKLSNRTEISEKEKQVKQVGQWQEDNDVGETSVGKGEKRRSNNLSSSSSNLLQMEEVEASGVTDATDSGITTLENEYYDTFSSESSHYSWLSGEEQEQHEMLEALNAVEELQEALLLSPFSQSSIDHHSLSSSSASADAAAAAALLVEFVAPVAVEDMFWGKRLWLSSSADIASSSKQLLDWVNLKTKRYHVRPQVTTEERLFALLKLLCILSAAAGICYLLTTHLACHYPKLIPLGAVILFSLSCSGLCHSSQQSNHWFGQHRHTGEIKFFTSSARTQYLGEGCLMGICITMAGICLLWAANTANWQNPAHATNLWLLSNNSSVTMYHLPGFSSSSNKQKHEHTLVSSSSRRQRHAKNSNSYQCSSHIKRGSTSTTSVDPSSSFILSLLPSFILTLFGSCSGLITSTSVTDTANAACVYNHNRHGRRPSFFKFLLSALISYVSFMCVMLAFRSKTSWMATSYFPPDEYVRGPIRKDRGNSF